MAVFMDGPSDEVVGNEAAAVPGDRRVVLADADARGLLAHDPRADHRVVSRERRERMVRLPDETLLAVLARRLDDLAARADRDVGALARVERLLHEIGGELAGLE